MLKNTGTNITPYAICTIKIKSQHSNLKLKFLGPQCQLLHRDISEILTEDIRRSLEKVELSITLTI